MSTEIRYKAKNASVQRLLFSFFLLIVPIFAEAYEKMVLGVIEKITFLPEHVTLSAKLDTGAKTSSLGATDIAVIEKNGEKWVSFSVNTKKQQFHFQKKLEGYVKIKIRHVEKKALTISKGYVTRPVVFMEVQLGERKQIIEVNLANRKNFIYPFLLGRDAIVKLGGIIDPTQKFTVKKVKIKTNPPSSSQ